MSNFFRRGLCSILTAGFIFGGCSSLNNYESDLFMREKSLAKQKESVQTPSLAETYPSKVQNSFNVSPLMGIDKSKFYLTRSASFDENKFLEYKDLSMPKADYLTIDRGQRGARENLREQILRTLGWENTILSGKLFYNNNADLRIKPNINPFSNERSAWAVVTFRF